MNLLLSASIALFFMSGLVSAGWFGKSREEKRDEEYLSICRHYNRIVLDTRFWGKIEPQQFLQWATFLQGCYSSGKFKETNYNQMLVSSFLELPQLAKCTNDNYKKFETARARASALQNAADYVKWQLDLFERKCLDWQYQRINRPPEGSTIEGGPWPTTPAG